MLQILGEPVERHCFGGVAGVDLPPDFAARTHHTSRSVRSFPINAGDESDRILIRWDLKSPKARAAAEGRAIEPYAAEEARTVLSVGQDGEPVTRKLDGPGAMIQVPDDIVAIRRAQPGLARRWRQAVRETLGGAMARGYRVTGATRAGGYVLKAPPS